MSVEGFEASIAQHLRAIHDTAAGSPPGGGPAWDQLLSHYGVAGVGPDERAAVARAMGLERGATPGEVRMVLDGLVRWAEGELGRMAQAPALASDPRVAWWKGNLTTLAQTESDRYERAIGYVPPLPLAPAPPAPALASIFANAQATAKQVPWAGMKYEQAAVLTCVHCGGPQERPQDFMCRYCRRPIAGKIEKNV
jgi:hypothetical protein